MHLRQSVLETHDYHVFSNHTPSPILYTTLILTWKEAFTRMFDYCQLCTLRQTCEDAVIKLADQH